MEAKPQIEMVVGQRYWATRPYGYNGKELDRGQVFVAEPCRGNLRLGRYGYVGLVHKRAELYQCDTCGAEFIDEPCRRAHYEKRHRVRELTPFEEDTREEREERMLAEVAPVGRPEALAAS